MKEMTARDAKNHFGELLEAAQRGPIKITKNGRGVAVLLRLHEFKEAFEEAEDQIWGERANEAMKHPKFIGTKKSAEILKKYLSE